MKRGIIALGTCAALATLPMQVFAHGHDEGAAVLGGIVGGVVGGLIGSGVAPFPIYAAPAPVVVERYAPAPIVVERGGPPVAYYVDGHRGYRDREWREHEWREHHWHHDRWHDDD